MSTLNGFPWLRESDRAAVRQADFFVDRCLDAIQLQINSCKHFLIEHPEDLGVTRTGAHPASVWQLSRLRNLIEASASTFALHQCHFGSASQKPTRLAGNLPSWAHMSVAWPQFDRTGHYCGPLPQCTEHEHESLIGFNSETNAWRTTSSASYPSAFCAMLARNILSAARSEATPPAPLQLEGGHMSLPPFPPLPPAGGQVSAIDPASNLQGFPPVPPPLQNLCEASSFNLPSFDPSAGSWQSPCETSGSAPDSYSPPAGLPRSSFGDVKEPSVVVCSSDEETELLAPLKEEQFDPRFSRCFGPPISCRHDPKHPEFNDGFGLCSPGRWRPQAREKLASPAEREHSFRVREILNQVVRSEIEDPRAHALRLAAGRIKASPFSAGALHVLCIYSHMFW